MEFWKTENLLLDKGHSKIDTQTIAFNAEAECVQIFFATMPQFAASHPALTKKSSRRGCLEKEQ